MFPDFNIYSTPLLVLAIQGLLFALLLLWRYAKDRNIADVILGVILLISVWHQISYTLGFMAWYDTFRTTKVNYFLINLSFFFAPLLYFYVKSITVPHFRLRRKEFYHFIPGVLFLLFKIIILSYDAAQPGFSEIQNGYLTTNLEEKFTRAILSLIMKIHSAIYIAFTFQAFFQYRKKLPHVFSNTYALELNWIRNFLIIYTGLFVYMFFQDLINFLITDLSWVQEWWFFLFNSIAIIYVGMVGYFTNTNKLNELHPKQSDMLISSIEPLPTPVPKQNNELSPELQSRKLQLDQFIDREKPYLDPDLNLIDLAKSLKMTRAQLSEVINVCFNKNFNDFINEQRVEAVKEMLKSGKQKELSLLGIAFDCGFNSKATFNRVFKKWTGHSPTAYIETIGS